MPDQELRHKTVAVAVVFNKDDGFLLWNNTRWGGYAFPMKKMDEGDDPAQAALQAIDDRDFPLELPNASAGDLEETGLFGTSDAVNEDTYYDYHVCEIGPGQPLNPDELHPDVRFFTYDQLQAATNVTWSTRALAASLVESQEVVVAVICRQSEAGLEFLLVHNRNYGYFFPSIRRKTHGPLEEMAVQSVRFDLAYDGAVKAKYCGEVPHVRPGTRFGASERRYRYYVCCVCFTDADLSQQSNPLQQAVDAIQAAKAVAGQQFGERGYWDWFTIDEMKQRDDMSPDVTVLLPAAIECAEQCEGGVGK